MISLQAVMFRTARHFGGETLAIYTASLKCVQPRRGGVGVVGGKRERERERASVFDQ